MLVTKPMQQNSHNKMKLENQQQCHKPEPVKVSWIVKHSITIATLSLILTSAFVGYAVLNIDGSTKYGIAYIIVISTIMVIMDIARYHRKKSIHEKVENDKVARTS